MRATDRYVLDSNIVVSAMMFPTSVPGQALKKAIRSGTVVVSAQGMDELAHTVLNPKFDRYVPLALRQAFLQEFGLATLTVRVTTVISECRDPKDDYILALAIDASAKAIITGDHDLLVMHPFRGVNILTPADFVRH